MASPQVRKIPKAPKGKYDDEPDRRYIRPQKKYRLPITVFDAALERIRWLMDEFDGKVAVYSSGGKDSTVIMELACQAAAEKGYGPPPVIFLDQEVEFQGTVEYQRRCAYERSDIAFYWYQVPFYMGNATNHDEGYLHAWGEDAPMWMRDREPCSFKDNRWIEERTGANFYKLLDKIGEDDFHGYVSLDGLRIEESPDRRLHTISQPCYKWVTWSAGSHTAWRRNEFHRYRFHPIYDWRHEDIWKAIEENGWDYNGHYDEMFRWGVKKPNMRVSSITHSKALGSLAYLQEVEPETWEMLTARLEGINSFGQTRGEEGQWTLPYMFASWYEYMCHLIEKVPGQQEERDAFWRNYRILMDNCTRIDPERVAGVVCGAVATNESYGIFANNFIQKYGDRAQERRARDSG